MTQGCRRPIQSICALVLIGALANPIYAAVGRTAGNFSVSSTGAAIYSVPIFTPPGPKGIQPSIALVYSSTGGAGPVGKGWSIAGLSAITRCNKTIAQDGADEAIKLQASDGYCLNGNRLRLYGGTYGATGSTYQTEIADFSLVTAGGTASNGPGSFTVQSGDGLTYDYGTDSTSQVLATGTSTVSQWLLREIRDSSNNRVRFTYAAPTTGLTGTTHPVSIEWAATTSGGSTFLYSMVFNYISNVPASSRASWVAGTAVTDNFLLNDVSVSSSTFVRKYLLGYDTSPSSGAYRLHTVTECSDSAGSDCLASTTVGYQNTLAGVVSTGYTGAIPSNDLNGDGYPETITLAGSTFTVTWGGPSGGSTTSIGPISGLGSKYLIGDVTGTGKATLLTQQSSVWWAYTWNGSSFTATNTGISVASSTTYYLADSDGDGRKDLFVAPYTNPNGNHYAYGTISYRLSTGSSTGVSFSSTVTTAINLSGLFTSGGFASIGALYYSGQTVGRYNAVDVNGDSREDMGLTVWTVNCANPMNPATCTGSYSLNELIAQPNGTYALTVLYSTPPFPILSGITVPLIQFTGVNDDQCTDIVSNGSSSGVYLSGCNGSAGAGVTLSGNYRGSIDWDGDGRADMLTFVSGSTLSVSLSTGTAFAAPTATGVPSTCISVAAIDINGDGADDLGCTNSAGSTSYYLHNPPADLATSFVDGYGVSQTVTYAPADQNYYTPQTGATYPYQNYAGAMELVGSVVQSDGAGGTYTLSYLYNDGISNLQSSIFAGFGQRKVTDSRTGNYTIEYYRPDFPYTGMLSAVETYQSSGTPISRQWTTFSSTSLAPVTLHNERYFVYPSYISSLQYEVGGTANGQLITGTGESRTYDNYGNPTQITRTVMDDDPASPLPGSAWTTTTTSTISPDTGANWCLSLPTEVTVAYSSSVPGETSVTRTTDYTPDYVHCRRAAEIIEPGSSTRRVDTSYGFDAYGNIDSVAVTGKDSSGSWLPAARTTTTIWGSANGSSGGTGQFPVSETNAMGLSQTTTRTFDEASGQLATQTDPNNILVVDNRYDAFGRLEKTYRPDGTWTWFELVACTVSGVNVCRNGDPASGATSINKTIRITHQKDPLNADFHLDWTYLDSLDRPIVQRSQTLSGGYSRVGRQYDAMGRVSRQTAPCDEASCTAYWTTNSYDLVGRITQQVRPHNEGDPTPLSSAASYAGRTSSITDAEGKNSIKILDVNGRLRRSQDHNGYAQLFGYDAAGSLTRVTDSATPANTLFTASYSYGIQPFQDVTSEMDLGARNYYYNSLGDLTSWSDGSHTFSQAYDPLSRVTSRTEAEGTTTWTWGTNPANHEIGQLAGVSMTGYAEIYAYNALGRLVTQTVTSDQNYVIDFDYTTQGQLATLTYPTNPSSTREKARYCYAYGILQSVTDSVCSPGSGTTYWTANAQDAWGQITEQTLGNGIVIKRNFDAVTGWLNYIHSGTGLYYYAQNQTFGYDKIGNITQRMEANLNVVENFCYDNLYRLTSSALGSSPSPTCASPNLTVTYDPVGLGNITSRSDVPGAGSWSYDSTKKHAVVSTGSGGTTYSYDNNGNMTARGGTGIGWTSYNYPWAFSTGTESAIFHYGPDRQYYQQDYTGPSVAETTYYIGGILEKVCSSLGCISGATDWRHYISANGQTVAIVSRNSSGTRAVNYPLEDHQGSGSRLTDSSGTGLVWESFNAFGKPRDGNDWDGAVPSGDLTTIEGISRRGFTGHTMLGRMDLIHMNGRVQDAVTGRFLSPDPHIPDPGFTQSFNRYAYVNNNPLSYIDPSGFEEERPAENIDGTRYWCASFGIWSNSPGTCDLLRQYYRSPQWPPTLSWIVPPIPSLQTQQPQNQSSPPILLAQIPPVIIFSRPPLIVRPPIWSELQKSELEFRNNLRPEVRTPSENELSIPKFDPDGPGPKWWKLFQGLEQIFRWHSGSGSTVTPVTPLRPVTPAPNGCFITPEGQECWT